MSLSKHVHRTSGFHVCQQMLVLYLIKEVKVATAHPFLKLPVCFCFPFIQCRPVFALASGVGG